MDLWELIKNDHDNVDQIFEQIIHESSGDFRDKLFGQLKRELLLHTKVEDDIFYPALEDYEETRTFLPDARKEHAEMRRMLNELSSGSKDSEEWAGKLDDLKDLVHHHVRDEEQKIFPPAQRVMDPARAEELTRRIEHEKIEVLGERV